MQTGYLTALLGVLPDARYAWRGLRRTPGFTTIAVLTLALGVGGGAAFAALTRAIVFAPIPIEKLDGVLATAAMERRTSQIRAAFPLFGLRTLEAHVPDSVLAVGIDAGTWIATLQTTGAAEQAAVGAVSGGYARVLDLPVQAGRWIGPDDDLTGASAVVVIGDRLWREWFRGRRDAIGQATVTINARPFTVVGVAPAGFVGLRPGTVRTEAWVSIETSSLVFPQRATEGLGLIKGRPGITTAQLQGSVRNAAGAGLFWSELLLRPVRDTLRDAKTTSSGWLILALAVLVWIASCANLANLLYARTSERTGETAVRLSLGASRVRILRLFFAETTIVAAIAMVLGVMMASGAIWMFGVLVPETLGAGLQASPQLVSTTQLGLYAGAAALAAAVIVGVATARHASRSNLQTIAASGGHIAMTARGGARRTALVALQITVAVMLVMGAGLYVERYRQAARAQAAPARDTFDASHVATARLDLGMLDYSGPRGLAFFGRLVDDLRRLPDIDGVAVATTLPTSEPGTNWSSVLTDQAVPYALGSGPRRQQFVQVQSIRASSGFFEAIGVTVRRSAGFSTWDTPDGPPIAVISESAAAALWPGQDPMGRRIMLPHARLDLRRMDYDAVEVVGVSADPVRLTSTSPKWAASVMVMPVASWWVEAKRPALQVILRAPRPAAEIEPLRQTIRALDPAVAMLDASTRDDYVRAQYGVTRALDALMAALGALAFAIAMLGVYGVIAYFVSTRTREFGVRLALGATPPRIVRLVIDHAIHIVLVGLLPGVFIVSVSSRLLQAHVLDLMPNDITTWAAVPLLILAAGIIAGYLPARRAARVDPNVALRQP